MKKCNVRILAVLGLWIAQNAVVMSQTQLWPEHIPADTSELRTLYCSSLRSCVMTLPNRSLTGNAGIKTIDYYDGFGLLEETVKTEALLWVLTS